MDFIKSKEVEEFKSLMKELVQEFRTYNSSQRLLRKPWLTAEETCQILGLEGRGHNASRYLKGLETALVIRRGHKLLVEAKSVWELHKRIQQNEVVLTRVGGETRVFRP